VNTIWALVGLAALGAVIALITSLRRGDRDADMGAVSSQWLQEQRLGPGSDARR
jgi:hypothetical protein